METEIEKFKLTTKPICDCKGNKISCITPKDWAKSQVAVWRFSYEKRDIRDKTKHPATYPIAFSSKVINLLSHKGELVIHATIQKP